MANCYIVLFFPTVDCGPLTIMNGMVDTTSGTTFMNTATYSCDTGYNLTGEATRMCQANGNWSGSEPTCPCKLLNMQLSFSSNHTFQLLIVDPSLL